jgi:HD-GYP domain-containing protein (c-di-GMP phosphodiesterase class II)
MILSVRRSSDREERPTPTHVHVRETRDYRNLVAALDASVETQAFCFGRHAERVSELAGVLAHRLGYAGEELGAVELGGLVHELGKVAIPRRILQKPATLDEAEWDVMRRHPIVSEDILSGIELHPFVARIARSSHERIDGAGYPDGLAGDDIPLPARIVLVADAFDALTSDRPYRARRPEHQALAEIRANAGTQFCPTVVATLDRIAREQPEILGTIPVWAVNVA